MTTFLVFEGIYLFGLWRMSLFYNQIMLKEASKEDGRKFSRVTYIISCFLWPVVIIIALIIVVKRMIKL